MSNENKVVLPEPVEQVKEVMVLVGKYGSAVEANSTGNPSNYTLASDESAAYAAIKTKLRALLATGGQAQADCERCKGSGEDPEGYYDQSRGPDGDTHEGPCRTCNGTGAAPQQADSRDAVTFEQRMSDWQHGDALDAERYRWLRSRDLETISQGGVFAGMTPQNVILNEEDLDQAVDAAIAAAKGLE